MNVCNISDTITPVLCTSKYFFNCYKNQDRIYTRPGSYTVQLNHIVMATDKNPRFLTTEAVKGVDSKLQNLTNLKKNSTAGQKSARTRIIKNNKMKNEKRPGLRNIKQVDIYHKWGPLVSEEFRDDICPKPSNTIIKYVKDERKAKREIRKYT